MDNTNNTIQRNKIGFIGFGLIGGSISKAIKEFDKTFYTYAYNHHDTPNLELETAKSDGVLDQIFTSLDVFVPKCDVLILCAPVLTNIDYLKKIKPLLKPTCILTDVGSVKGNIHTSVTELGIEEQFIGGHPMTGSEKTGYDNSYALLLENAYYILTPTEKTPKEMVDFLYYLVEKIGSIPIILDPKEHDEITATISHIPHIIAAQLVNLVRNSGDKAHKMKALAAGGFKDITRIASASPIMWQNICLTNKDDINKLLGRYIDSLFQVAEAISQGDKDYLYKMFEQAGEFRDEIPSKSTGLMEKSYEIYLDIIDEAGAIASITHFWQSTTLVLKI